MSHSRSHDQPRAVTGSDGVVVTAKKKKHQRTTASPLMGGDPLHAPAPARTPSSSGTGTGTGTGTSTSTSSPSLQNQSAFKRQRLDSGEGVSTLQSPKMQQQQQQQQAIGQRELQGKAQQLLLQRMRLPIWSARQNIVDAVRTSDTVVLLAETGSGKTTQVPQFLYEAGMTDDRAPLIGVTQPRRVAATSLASRVSAEMGEPDPGSINSKLPRNSSRKNGKSRGTEEAGLGRVGYAIRFDDRTGPKTAIRFMTDGLLLREVIGTAASTGFGKRGQSKETHSQADQSAANSGPTHSMLDRYSVLIIDEAHERTVDTDLLLGLVKRIQAKRKEAHIRWKDRQARRARIGSSTTSEQTQHDADAEPRLLKVVVMSATLDAEKFSTFFSLADAKGRAVPAPILYVQGRMHKVRLSHTLEPCLDWTEAARATVFQIHTTRPPGDVLIFGTGAEEIDGLCHALSSLNGILELHDEGKRAEKGLGVGRVGEGLLPVPLYAALGPVGVAAAFAPTPPGYRKVIVATNIAETSITLPNIRYVIDCGLAKERGVKRGGGGGGGARAGLGGSRITSLDAGPISKSAADQRAGRAGRTADGDCFRLYTLQSYEEELAEESTPEVERADLTNAFLALFSIGIMPHEFEWISRPEEEEVHASIVALSVLGAIEPCPAPQKGMRITRLGTRMAALPLPAPLARTLIAAGEEGPTVSRQARDLVAILSSDRASVLYLPAPHLKDASIVKSAGAGAGVGAGAKGKSESDKAAEAHAKFAHPTGDHATQLTALYAYMDANEEFSSKLLDLDGSGAGAGAGMGATNGWGKGTFKRRNMELKAWCEANYVSFRNVKQVLDIRRQIDLICKTAGIVCDDHDRDLGRSERGRSSGLLSASSASASASASTSARSTPDLADENEMLRKADGLFVRRGGNASRQEGLANASGVEDYSALRRCLLKGRPADFAIRQDDGSYIKDGRLTLRIHPSSFLFGHNNPTRSSSTASAAGAPSNAKPSAIIFDEVLFTTQYFARTVSAIEPAELASVDEEIRNRPALAGFVKRLEK
ncbi:P-loop containing nucleoside triphosphate hydrolase protein [Ceraceosorus guamensis]|uniref:P-loop containing nucleoside triphosphate hydrolase protein n=1 Tax=Ceraceosorus guamensis TaxID=1522189 RepID=A0A316VR66_9BASI|nr:P-loop containing nucleoside triphosphate hydrolase protein [Ceraceosorus guamensis]PWN38893.1 P-loop containing nucleoside triphosphate hydrolase protein [Ceraceosorus guamensis]